MERYEEWDVTIPSIPPRSRLYQLEPIGIGGIGTPYVESLTSYVARLAELQCVKPKNLVMKVLLPSQSQASTIQNDYKFFISNAPNLNGSNLFATHMVEALQALTLCKKLTLRPM